MKTLDIITQFFHGVHSAAAGLDSRLVAFLIKLALLLGVPSLLCFLSHQQGHTTKALQICWCVIGVLLVGLIPTEMLTITYPTARVWIIVLAALAVWFLPRALAFLLEPMQAAQQRLASRLYLIVGMLIVLEVFLKGGR